MTNKEEKDLVKILNEVFKERPESSEISDFDKNLNIPNGEDWKNIQDAQKGLIKEQEITNRIVIGIVFVLAIAFIGWIYDSIRAAHSEREKYYEKAIELEKRIGEYEVKYQLLEKEIEGLNNYIDIKVERKIKETQVNTKK